MVNEILAAVEQTAGYSMLSTLMTKAGMVVTELLPDIDAVRQSSTPEMLGGLLGSIAGGWLGYKAGIFFDGVVDPRPMARGALAGAILGGWFGHVVF